MSVSRENSCSRNPGGKHAGGSWCGPKRRLRSETKIWPRDAYPRGLILGLDPVMVIGIDSRFTPPPPGGRYLGKTLVLEISGCKCVRCRG